MRFASLGSGSRGNATLVCHGRTRLLVDCGFSAKEAEKRLQRLGMLASELTAIVLTHEHVDHIKGIRVLAKNYGLPIYATRGTASHLDADTLGLVKEFSSHNTFEINDIELQPFPVPHDAREPTQFVFSTGQHRLGLLTDTGWVTPIIETTLADCDALLIEANHDTDILNKSDYPQHLKYRISGRLGHLNNVQSATLLEKLNSKRLQHVVAMHLSEQNNTPELVSSTWSDALNCEVDWIGIAQQNSGFDWREIQ